MEKVASASVAFSASELVVFDSLSLNILQATSWLDHGLVNIIKMLEPEINWDHNELILFFAYPSILT